MVFSVMASSWRCVFVVVVLVGSLSSICEAAKNECTEQQTGSLRLDAKSTNSSCSYVEGVVQTCEDLEWRILCDTQWTVQDAQVACRSLNYTATGRQVVNYFQYLF